MNNKINTEGNIEVDVDTSLKGVEKLEINSEVKIEPIVVKYCESCHFPEEFCEYSHTLLLKKLNQIIEEPIKEEKKEGETKTEEAKTEAKPDKKKPKEKTQILIELSKRGKKKHVTYVFNIEKFGLNMKDVAKLFSKKFACSSTVTKEDNGQEGITLTGEFGYEIVEFLTEKFPAIKPDMCKVIEPKPKGESAPVIK